LGKGMKMASMLGSSSISGRWGVSIPLEERAGASRRDAMGPFWWKKVML
jgi:hypothetical protein